MHFYSQYFREKNGVKYYDHTIITQDFVNNFLKANIYVPKVIFTDDTMVAISKNKDLDDLQQFYEKKGAQVCMANFVHTCATYWEYLQDNIYVLLKPTIADIADNLDLVKEVGGSTNTMLLDVVKKAIKDNAALITYETQSLLFEKDIKDKSNTLAKFCFGMATFLNQFLPIKRRGNCGLIEGVEQEGIIAALKEIKVLEAKTTRSRFRQLMKVYKDKGLSITEGPRLQLDGRNIKACFIKYSEWSKGLYESTLEKGEKVMFTGIDNPPQWYLDAQKARIEQEIL